MKLGIHKSKNRTFYYVEESYRISKNKVSTRIYEKIGSHEQLLKKGIKDPLAYAKKRVDELNNNRKENKLVFNERVNFTEIIEGGEIETRNIAKNIGWLYLKSLLDKLKIDDYLNSIQGKFQYDLNAIFKHLVCDRVLYPSSKIRSYKNKNKYISNYNFGIHDIYRSLKKLSENTNSMQKHLYDETAKIIKLDNRVLFYDCTNFYCETETEDEDVYEGEDIIQYGLRKYGAGKEHRPNPIVLMGLFTETNGIPIAYTIKPGNTNEQITTIPLERRIIDDYGTSKFIYCADGGLGSFDNRFFNTLNHRNYIVTQSLKKTQKKELDLIMKDMNWRFVDNDEKVSLIAFKTACDKLFNQEKLTSEEENLLQHDMIYKLFPFERDVPLKFIEEMGMSKKSKIKMDETVYITFSKKYYLYQKQIFTRQLETAKSWLSRDVELIKKGPNDIRRFIKIISSTKEGEIASKKKQIIDTEVVEKEKYFHGFYAVATSLTDTNVQDILNINASRWKIEQSFRLLKSDFDTRPYYMSTEEGIKGHFVICYVALLLYRILERLILQINTTDKITSNNILSTLRNMEVVSHKDFYYESIYTGSKVLDSLEKIFKLNLNRKTYKMRFFKKLQ